MKRYSKYIIYTLLLLVGIGCDDGRIYPEEEVETGRSAVVTVSFKNLKAWPKENMISLCSFGEDRTQPLQTQRISKPTSENKVFHLTLNNVTPETRSVEIAVISRGLRLIYSYYATEVSSASDKIELSIDKIDLASFKRIQAQVFDKACLSCHGESTSLAGQLDLRPKVSYKSLVNVQAPMSKEGKNYVTPKSINNSYLLDILEDNPIHSDMFNSAGKQEIIALIQAWILGGALDN